MPAAAPGPITVLRGHHSDVQCLRFFSDDLLFSGDASGHVKTWNMPQRRAVGTQQLHSESAGILALQLGGPQCLVSQGRDGEIRSWHILPDGGLARHAAPALLTGAYTFCRMATCHWSPGAADDQRTGGRSVVSPGEEPADLIVWDLETGTKQAALRFAKDASAPPKHGMAMAVQAFNRTGVTHVLSGYEDGSVALWDSRRVAAPLAVRTSVHSEAVMCLAVSPTGTDAISGSADNKLCCFQLRATDRTADASATTPSISTRASSTSTAACSPATTNEACGTSADQACGNPHQEPPADLLLPPPHVSLTLSAPGVADVVMRPDGKLFASAGWDGKVRLFSSKRDKPALAVLKYHTGQVTCVDFAADSSLLASGGRDNTIAVWSVYPPKAA